MVPAAPLPTVCPAMCAPSGAGASGQLSMVKMVPVRSESFKATLMFIDIALIFFEIALVSSRKKHNLLNCYIF